MVLVFNGIKKETIEEEGEKRENQMVLSSSSGQRDQHEKENRMESKGSGDWS